MMKTDHTARALGNRDEIEGVVAFDRRKRDAVD
jgi:hypothetical protein